MQTRAASNVRRNWSKSLGLGLIAGAMAFAMACGTRNTTLDGSGGDGASDGSTDSRTDGNMMGDVASDGSGMDAQGGDVATDTIEMDTGGDTVITGDTGPTTDTPETGTCTPTAEVCNGRDDNCNGMVDEGLGTTTCGTGECRRTVPNCLGGAPQSCTPLTGMTEICDGLDNDCNGMVDDGLGQTTCGMGACQHTVDNCVSGSPMTCTPGMMRTEVCNGMDDDNLPPITCGVGACLRTVVACMGGTPQSCIPGPTAPETCDNADNNCDGTVDEGDPGGGAICTTGLPGVCSPGVLHCQSGTLRCVPNVAPMSRAETCNGQDDDCDSMIDNAPIAALCPAPAGGVMTTCSGAGGCTISGCPAGAYDVDANYSNGCECVDDTIGASCTGPTNAGSVAPGGTFMSPVGRVPPSGGSDWYVITFPESPDFRDHGVGTPTITFAGNDNNAFRFEVRSAACPGTILGCGTGSASATGLTTWSFNDTCVNSATDCSTRGTAWPSTVYVKVYRVTAGASCDNYQLRVTRP